MRRLTGALLGSCSILRRSAASPLCVSQAPPLLLFASRCFSVTSTLHATPSTGADAASGSGGQEVSITDQSGKAVDVAPLHNFADLKGAPKWLAEGLSELGYPSTTNVQKFTIPLLADGHHAIGLAPTGSGKTVAFAVPALMSLKRNPDNSPAVLILVPTRELVQQTIKVFQSLGRGQVRVSGAYGGTPRDLQARSLHSGCDVLVACPGRLKDFLDSGDVSIRNLSLLVFDEADRLLDMGFSVVLDEIMGYLDSSASPQTMMWSATWPESVQALADKYLAESHVLIRAGTAGTGLQVNMDIKQEFFFHSTFAERIEKLGALVEAGTIDDNTDKLILFVERQTDTESTANAFSNRLGIDSRYVGVIHGGLSQRSRDKVMRQFKDNHVRILVATDVAARGLDIPDVTCVVNFQAPKGIDSYCHRIGRTGRAGRSGTAYTFLGPSDGALAADLIDYLGRSKCNPPPELANLVDLHRGRTQFQQQRLRGRGRGGRSRGGGGGGRFARDYQEPHHRQSGDSRRNTAGGISSALDW
ncbi:DEAD-box ATP-dependent RNA helicase, mitochondrial [Novymonas esmeraldas]|uniref:RNA helicase n=1 Tax=Novymonas esmeraldas TaxID=1808958 RepID=A0AAW0EWJ4_9TRYP